MATWFLKRGRRLLALTLMLAVLVLSGALVVYADSTEVLADPDPLTLQTTPGPPPQGPPPPQGRLSNAIVNGSFEKGFVNGLADGWGQFQNGNVAAGWYDDTWEKVVFDGEHAQLMELKDAREMDRYVGIFQAVHVAPDSDYLLTLHGLVRSVPGSPELTDFGFRMQYGIDYRGGTDWKSSEIEWIELPWDEQPRTEPTRIEVYSTTIKTKGPQLTLFIRGWKKWADAVEGDYDVDGVSLIGPLGPSGQRPPHDMQPPPGQQPPPSQQPSPTAQPQMPISGNAFSILGNPVVTVPSIGLLVILIGGATWRLTRRRE